MSFFISWIFLRKYKSFIIILIGCGKLFHLVLFESIVHGMGHLSFCFGDYSCTLQNTTSSNNTLTFVLSLYAIQVIIFQRLSISYRCSITSPYDFTFYYLSSTPKILFKIYFLCIEWVAVPVSISCYYLLIIYFPYLNLLTKSMVQNHISN